MILNTPHPHTEYFHYSFMYHLLGALNVRGGGGVLILGGGGSTCSKGASATEMGGGWPHNFQGAGQL